MLSVPGICTRKWAFRTFNRLVFQFKMKENVPGKETGSYKRDLERVEKI